MKHTDALIIGGSAAGMVAALTGKSYYSDKKFTLVKKVSDVMVPCGIPYIFGTLGSSDKNLMPVDAVLEKNGIESLVDEAVDIDIRAKVVSLSSGETVHYDRLVIATGSNPVRPGWLEGGTLDNVFVIRKDRNYLDDMKKKIEELRRIVVIGAGFIGVEFSDELAKEGHEVTLVEKLQHVLYNSFDEEVSEIIHRLLTDRGIDIATGVGVSRILGTERVEGVLLEDGRKLVADAVVLSMGYRPNSELAKKAGIYVDEDQFIAVDEYMRTHEVDVFAAGDCAQKRDFVTRRRTPVMLASTACAEARIAGMNLFNINVVKTFSGTISIYSTALGAHGFGTAGLTERRARQEGIVTVSAVFEGVNRHPGNLPGSEKQIVKLIAAQNSGVIIGGEAYGGPETGELTNVIGLAIQNRMSVNSFLTMQIGTHPCLTASPAAYPLIKVAELIALKLLNRNHV
ncbi:MAG: FAD-dependent oxidoreductase [Bacteroidetes bacterium]|nr:FAD-dependent oxidoreductase [Bacteroidota bacterium]